MNKVSHNAGAKLPGEILTPEEIQLLLGSFSSCRTGIRNRAMVAVGLYASLRCAEICDLQSGDVDLEKFSVLVRNGKGGKTARVGLSRSATPYLRSWFDVRPDSRYLFCTLRGDRVHEAYVRACVPRQAKKAGIAHRVHCHALRHSSAVALMNAGVPLVAISRQLRHSSIAVTHTYLNHLDPEELIAAVSAVEF